MKRIKKEVDVGKWEKKQNKLKAFSSAIEN